MIYSITEDLYDSDASETEIVIVTSLPVIRAAGMSTRRRVNTVTFVALKTSDSGPQRAELQRQQDDDDTAMTHLLCHNINTIHTAEQLGLSSSSSSSSYFILYTRDGNRTEQ